MALLPTRLGSLGAKGLAAAGAATLMVGGGVAVAQNAGLDNALEQAEANELPEVAAAPGVLAELAEDESDVEPDAELEILTEEGQEENLTEAIVEDELDDECVEDTDEAEDCGPSETAQRVHSVLAGEEDADPRDGDFGQKVSERARSGHLGPAVSAAARGDDGWEDGIGDLPPKPGHDDDEDEEDETITELSGASSESGPPAHAKGQGKGKGRG